MICNLSVFPFLSLLLMAAPSPAAEARASQWALATDDTDELTVTCPLVRFSYTHDGIWKAKMADTIMLRVRGADPVNRYRVSFGDGSNPAVEKTGAELDEGLPVTLKGAPVWIEEIGIWRPMKRF